MTESAVPFTGWPTLRPDYIRRRLDQDERARLRNLTIAAEAACSLAYCHYSSTNETLFEAASKILTELIRDLVEVMDLTALEVCDNGGQRLATIARVSEHVSGSPYELTYLDLDNGDEVTPRYVQDALDDDGYVRLPHSQACGPWAIIEAARAQLKDKPSWQQQEARP
jgi:hypothetical protein